MAAPADGPLDRMWSRGRTSLRVRVARLRSKSFAIAQCALAAGIAWFIAADLLGHQTPFFAPIAAVVSLGTSYGQRLRRVAEVTIGVAVGVLLGDLLVFWLGSGLVAGVAGGGPGHVAGLPARRRTAAGDPGRRAVDRHHHPHRRPGRGLHALDRRPHRRLRRPGRGDRGARSPAAPAPGAGLRGAAQGRRAAARGRRRDGRRGGRPRARGARRRPPDRLPHPGAPLGGRRGPGRGGLEPVPGAAQGRAETHGRSWWTRSTGRCAAPACSCATSPCRRTSGAPSPRRTPW